MDSTSNTPQHPAMLARRAAGAAAAAARGGHGAAARRGLASYAEHLQFKTIADRHPLTPEDFAGKPLLLVNTASLCGLTPQLKELQQVHKRWGKDLTVLAVPSNDFGKQEPWGELKIKEFYATKYGVTFPIAAKERVAGPHAHPAYAAIARDLGADAAPQWNFHKYLLSHSGELIGVFGHIIPPTDVEVTAAIEEAVADAKAAAAEEGGGGGAKQ